MAVNPQSDPSLMRIIRATVARKTDGPPDGELLQRFVSQGDQTAFELLVWRYCSMVSGVCRARIRDHHIAEDAVQAVFMAFARSAKSIGNGRATAGWLQRVAQRISCKASIKIARGEKVTTEVLDQLADPSSEHHENLDTIALLHEEVARLSERYRVPIVLCYFEELSVEAAARRMGSPVGTVKSLLTRGREILHRNLTRRGVAASIGLTALFQACAVEQARAALVEKTMYAALSYALRLTMPENLSVAAKLADEAIKGLAFENLRLAAGLAALCTLLIFGGATLSPEFAGRANNEDPTKVREAAIQKQPEVYQSEEMDRQTIEEFRKLGANFGSLKRHALPEDDFLLGEQLVFHKPLGLKGAILRLNSLLGEDGRLRSFPRVDVPIGICVAESNFSDEGLRGLASIPKLKQLILAHTRITDDGLKELARFHTLEYLTLRSTSITGDGLQHISVLTRLKSLDLSETKACDSGMNAITAFKNLEMLDLGETGVSDESLEHLISLNCLSNLSLSSANISREGARRLGSFPSLQRLNLNYVMVVDDESIESLKGLKNLEMLTLIDTNVTDRGMKDLASAENLSVLQLDKTCVGDVGVRELARMEKLTSLSLRKTRVTDLGASYLAGSPALITLNLSKTHLTDVGVKALAKHGTLRRLHLRNTGVTDNCIHDLAAIPNLAAVDLRGTRVTIIGVLEFKRLRPDCKIIR